jgi:hypothetical protein
LEEDADEAAAAAPETALGRSQRLILILAQQVLFHRHQRSSAWQKLVGLACYANNVPKCVYELLHSASMSLAYTSINKMLHTEAARAPSEAQLVKELGNCIVGYDNGQRATRKKASVEAAGSETMLHFAVSCLVPLPTPTAEHLAQAVVHQDRRQRLLESVRLEETFAGEHETHYLSSKSASEVTEMVLDMCFAATSPAARERNVLLRPTSGGNVVLYAPRPAFDAPPRPPFVFSGSGITALGSLPPNPLYQARLSRCSGPPVLLPVIFVNLGHEDGHKDFLTIARQRGLTPKIMTEGPVDIHEGNVAQFANRGAYLLAGDNGTNDHVRHLTYNMQCEPDPLDRIGQEVVAVHGPLHCQMQQLRQLGKPLFWGEPSQPGTLAYLQLHLSLKAVKRNAENFHASMTFAVDIVLPAYVRALVLHSYADMLSAAANVAVADPSAARQLLNSLGRRVVAERIFTEANPYVSDLLSFLCHIRVERAAIRAGQAQELPILSRLALPVYALLGATRYMAEEALLQANLLTLPPYLADSITEARVINPLGRLNHSKAVDHFWEEGVKRCKNAVGGLGGDAAKDKLLMYSKTSNTLMRADCLLRSLLTSSPEQAATGTSTCRKLSPRDASIECLVRKCTELILESHILDEAPQAGQSDSRPPWVRGLERGHRQLHSRGKQNLLVRGREILVAVLRGFLEASGDGEQEDLAANE